MTTITDEAVLAISTKLHEHENGPRGKISAVVFVTKEGELRLISSKDENTAGLFRVGWYYPESILGHCRSIKEDLKRLHFDVEF